MMRGFTLIILFFISITLFVDTINGIADYYSIPIISEIGKIYKVFLLFLILAYIGIHKKENFVVALSILLISFLSLFILYKIEGNNISVLQEFGFMLKIISPIIYFLFFKEIINTYFKKIKLIFIISIVIVALNLFLGTLGLGRSQYANDVGSIGFFIAGNEVSGLMIVLSAFLLQYTHKKYPKKYIYIALFVLILSLIKATKTAIFGQLIIAIAIPFLNSTKSVINLKKVSSKKLKLIAIGTISSFLGFIFIVGKSSVASRWVDNFSGKKIVTSLLSSRDVYLEQSFIMLKEDFSQLNFLFGKGFFNFQEIMGKYLPIPHTIEIDFFDIYYSYGFPITLLIYSFYGFVILKGISHYLKTKSYSYVPVALLTLGILFLVSMLAGHILTSGLCSVFIGVLTSLIYYKEDETA
jgi:hypothetical protein